MRSGKAAVELAGTGAVNAVMTSIVPQSPTSPTVVIGQCRARRGRQQGEEAASPA